MLEYISVNLNAKPEVINAFYKTIPVILLRREFDVQIFGSIGVFGPFFIFLLFFIFSY